MATLSHGRKAAGPVADKGVSPRTQGAASMTAIGTLNPGNSGVTSSPGTAQTAAAGGAGSGFGTRMEGLLAAMINMR